MKKHFAALLFICAGVAPAQSPSVLTLDHCLTLARQYSPRLRILQGRVQSAGLAREELRTTLLPQIRLAAMPIYAPFGSKLGYDPALSNGGQIVGQVVLQQSIYDGGVRSLKSDQIATDLARLDREYVLTDRDLAFAVQQAFFETLRSEQEIALDRESVQQLSDYGELVQRTYSGGGAAYTDVLRTNLQLADARMTLQKAQDEFALDKYRLTELIGNPIDTSFSVEGVWEPERPDRTDSLSRDLNPDSIAYIELSIADLELKSRMLDVQMAEHERWPVITFAADAGYANSGENLKLGPADRFSAVGFSMGLVVDLPLITWGATALRIQERQTSVDMLRLETNLLQRSLSAETKRTVLQLARSRERLQALRRNSKMAEENFLLTKSRFAGGGGLSLEVLTAQQTLREVKLAQLRALADIRLLHAHMEQLTTQ